MTFTEQHKIFRNNIIKFPAILSLLADELGVSIDSLDALEVGFNPKNQSWIFPERNEKGDIIGLAQRLLDGKKFMVAKSKRGLTYVLNKDKQEFDYKPGKKNWTRVSNELRCPLCGKGNGCLLPAGKESNPPAVVCVHIADGAAKELKLGYLHILKPLENIKSKRILPISEHPIVVVEGQTDVAAAWDMGLVAVGRPSATSGTTALAQLLRDKEVIVVGENDDSVGEKGMDSTFANLLQRCYSVIKVLPPIDVKDLRDWKDTNNLTITSFLAYVKEHGNKGENPNIFKNDVAHTIAEEWIKREKTLDGHLILRNYRSQWVEYQNNCYEELDTESFRGQLYKFLEGKMYYKVNAKNEVTVEPYKPTRAKVSDIIDALSQWCPILDNPPVWLCDVES